ncbi:MAG: ATP-dependent Clp protease proteolytic subunit [bacterium]
MKNLARCLLLILSFSLLWGTGTTAKATITKISNDTIILDTTVYGTEFREFLKATQNVKDYLHIYINSSGGDAFNCLAIMNYIKELKSRGVYVVTEVSGIALSAAANIWIMGNERIVHTNDIFMFHTAYIRNVFGSPKSKEDYTESDTLVYNALNNGIRQRLLEITHDTELTQSLLADVEGDLYNTHWFTGEQIFDLGLATKLIK